MYAYLCPQSDLAYSQTVPENITTLSTSYARAINGLIQGLLYVPDLDTDDPCQELVKQYIPRNATRQANLPQTDYNLIALAPWINANCSSSFLDAAKLDPLRAFLFYPLTGGYDHPPHGDDEVWDLDDDDWRTKHHYPVYVVPSASGIQMMHALSLYSGNISDVPFGENITELYHPEKDDWLRVWTELTVVRTRPEPSLWVYALIIVGVFLFVICGTSFLMHFVQNRRRASLRRRVMSGDCDLEKLGIKRMLVPAQHIKLFPLFTYDYDGPKAQESADAPREYIPKALETGLLDTQAIWEKYDLRPDYQPICLICLEEFESKVTVIRELSCGHIFHPECIDEFLSAVSSLCPICKQSMLPKGYCPKITNGMVRRELATRQLRRRIVDKDREEARGRIRSWGDSVKKRLRRSPAPSKHSSDDIELPELARVRKPTAIPTDGDASGLRQRMQELAGPLDEVNSDDGRPPWKRAFKKVFPGFH